MKHFRTLFIGLAMVLVLAACGSDTSGGDSSTSTPPTSGPSDASDLVGTDWIVGGFSVGGVDVALVPDADPTIAFSADGPDVFGTTGCNSYFASIDYGAAGEVTIGGVGQTEMACFPDEVMAQEQQFTAALSSVRLYDIDGDRLTLSSEDGAVVISAVNRDSVELPIQLGDVEWVADTRIEGDTASTLVRGTEVTLRFDTTGGELGGNSGCNVFGASFVTDDDRIRIADITGTERACDAVIMDQERFVYDVLADAVTFEIDGNRLTITTKDGRGLAFVAADTSE